MPKCILAPNNICSLFLFFLLLYHAVKTIDYNWELWAAQTDILVLTEWTNKQSSSLYYSWKLLFNCIIFIFSSYGIRFHNFVNATMHGIKKNILNGMPCAALNYGEIIKSHPPSLKWFSYYQNAFVINDNWRYFNAIMSDLKASTEPY